MLNSPTLDATRHDDQRSNPLSTHEVLKQVRHHPLEELQQQRQRLVENAEIADGRVLDVCTLSLCQALRRSQEKGSTELPHTNHSTSRVRSTAEEKETR